MPKESMALQVILIRLRALLKGDERIFFINRQKNLEELEKLDITKDGAIRLLEQLKPENYQKGPEDDHDQTSGSIFTFLMPHKGKNIYIKLKIFSCEEGDFLKIISFHC